MLKKLQREDTFAMYFKQWVTVYKVGAIREVTLSKYTMTQSWIERLAPDLKLCDLDRTSYQHAFAGRNKHTKARKHDCRHRNNAQF